METLALSIGKMGVGLFLIFWILLFVVPLLGVVIGLMGAGVYSFVFCARFLMGRVHFTARWLEGIFPRNFLDASFYFPPLLKRK